jgi:hypothetical protein
MREAFLAVAATLFLHPAFATTNATSGDITTLNDAQFNSQFRCPETIGDADERSAAVAGFVHWAKKQHPEWSVIELVQARIALLERHRCDETLKQIRDAAGKLPKP